MTTPISERLDAFIRKQRQQRAATLSAQPPQPPHHFSATSRAFAPLPMTTETATTSERVMRVIVESLGYLNDFAITPETNLVTDLQADSLDHLEIVMAIEDEFGIEIPDDVITEASPKTVQNVVDLVTSRLQPS